MYINRRINLPTDEKGFIGRECPKCHKYFKVKFETGLLTSKCRCPYCNYTGENSKFFTKDQIEYAENIAEREVNKQVIEPAFRKLERSFKEVGKRGLFQIEVKTQHSFKRFTLNDYQEKEVETYVTCDNCGLEFAIYGVFANCPNCGELNALIIFRKSIEVVRKKIHLLDSIKNDVELQKSILEDAISRGVSSFDAFGKALQKHYPEIFPPKPKNLFQNLTALSNVLLKSIGKSLSDILGKEISDFLFKMFQVRHIYEHNMGVIDENFVRKVPNLRHLKGRKYPLQRDEIERFFGLILKAADKILKIIENDKIK